MLWPICLVDCVTGLGETTTACTKYGHYEPGTVTMYISADAMILNFRNPKGYKTAYFLAQEHKH